MEFKYKVSIHCLTYNHENYLAATLDGFVSQKTNFPFVAVVIDDCSTDGTASVLREYEAKYPDIIKAYYLKENYHSQGKDKAPFLKPYDDQSQYIAICEGDDYWIDPLKLQKQVDILDADVSLIACVTNACVVDSKGVILKSKQDNVVKGNVDGRYDLRSFFYNSHLYPTATVIYRNVHRQEIDHMRGVTANRFFGDWNLWVILHLFGDFYYIDQVSSAYRINPTSVTHINVDKRRLEKAKANFGIIKQIQSILPDEYRDIRDDLDHTEWLWYNLAKGYKHTHKYFHMAYALLRCFIERPSYLVKKVIRKNIM